MLLRVVVVTQRVPCRSREPGTCHMAAVKHGLGFKARTSHVNVLKRMAEDLLKEAEQGGKVPRVQKQIYSHCCYYFFPPSLPSPSPPSCMPLTSLSPF